MDYHVFNNNGVTGVNAGNLGYTSSQTGEIINQIQRISIVEPLTDTTIFNSSSDEGSIQVRSITGYQNPDTGIRISNGSDLMNFDIGGGESFMQMFSTVAVGSTIRQVSINPQYLGVNFSIFGNVQGPAAFQYTASTDTLVARAANVIGFGGGADGLSITDTVNLNLLEGTTVLSTVVLPSSSGTTVIAGTTGEIVNTVSGDTNTLSLDTAITGAITANTAKTGITTAQAAAITSNTGKTGITVEQSNAIIANTSKTGITTAQATAITDNTAKVGITTAQATAITDNTAKVGITTAQATAITDNTAKVTYPTADSTKLAGIEALADVTDTTNVVGSLTAGANITISAAGVIAATAGGTGTVTSVTGTSPIDVATGTTTPVISLDTSVGNTWTETQVFNKTANSIQVASMTGVGDTTTYIALPSDGMNINIGGSRMFTMTPNEIEINTGAQDMDFKILKMSTGDEAITYDSGADTLTFDTTIVGLPDPTKTQVDTAIGSGTDVTDYYASDKTWKTIPSGGGSADAVEFMVTSYGFESDLSGAGGVFNFDSYTSTHSGTLNGFMRFYTNGALTDNGFYTGGATLRATTVAGTITLPTIDSNGNAIPAYTAGQSLVITNPAGDVFTANLASEVTTGLPTGFPTDLSPWRTSTTEVSAGFPADVVGDIFSTETVAVANQVFNQGALIYYLTEGYQKTSAGTLTTAGTAAEIPTVDTANDWTTTTSSGGAGTVTSVTGTANEVDVVTGTTTPVISLNNTITSAITANTSKVSFPGLGRTSTTALAGNVRTINTGESDKLANITVTQAVDLDTIESDTATNNAKITYPASASTKLGTIETNADVTDKANVDTAIGSGTLATDYYASDKTWRTIPTGGTGASLTADQTFTGVNTFSDTGGVLATRFTGSNNTQNYLGFFSTNINLVAGGNGRVSVEAANGNVTFNGLQLDSNFRVHGLGITDAIRYDSGTATLTSNASNFVGIAEKETGTWSPTFNRGGTITNPTATYSKVGNTVTVHYNGDVPGDGTGVNFTMNDTSLPFTISNSTPQSGGTYLICANALITNTSDSGVVTYYNNALYFMDSNNNQVLHGDELRGYLGFTFTYQTT